MLCDGRGRVWDGPRFGKWEGTVLNREAGVVMRRQEENLPARQRRGSLLEGGNSGKSR